MQNTDRKQPSLIQRKGVCNCMFKKKIKAAIVNIEPDKYWEKVGDFIIENNYRKEDLQ